MVGFCHIFAGGEEFADDAAVDECGEFFGLAKIDSTIIYEGLLLYQSQSSFELDLYLILLYQSRFDLASDTSTLWDI